MTESEIRYIQSHLQLSNRMIAQVLDLTEAQVRNFLHRQGITRTDEQLKQIHLRIGASQRGENNPNWRGGRSKDNYYYRKRAREKFPEKERARQIVYREKKKGNLIPEPCFICGETDNIEAHHPDHLQPLNVIWVCSEHHRQIEKEGSLFSGEIKDSVFHTVST